VNEIKPILIESTIDEDGVATIRLASPEVHNALTPGDLETLTRIIMELGEPESGARVLIITGSGDSFSAGANTRALGQYNADNISEHLASLLLPLAAALQESRLPSIAVVNGNAVGAGAGIAMLCDLVISSKSARFKLPFSQLGLVPDTGLTSLLPRAIGEARARALFFTGGSLSAAEAHAAGLVYAIYPSTELESHATDLAISLTKQPAHVFQATRRALMASRSNSLPEQLRFECELQAAAIQTLRKISSAA